MIAPRTEFTIGSFAKAAGVNVETIRFYQRRKLLPMPARPYGRIRRYGTADVARVRFIKAAQGLGFSLDEVAELLRLDDGAHCDDAREAAEAKLREVREKLVGLRRIEGALARLIRTCRAGTGRVQCPLIDSLRSGATRGRMAQ
ncbi:MAG TPA: Hg(II)-responsive transcriptional regulator [Gemmatimonadaceae bacterium]|jgi:MerR family mercuric resistance operon transcriptional regulator